MHSRSSAPANAATISHPATTTLAVRTATFTTSRDSSTSDAATDSAGAIVDGIDSGHEIFQSNRLLQHTQRRDVCDDFLCRLCVGRLLQTLVSSPPVGACGQR